MQMLCALFNIKTQLGFYCYLYSHLSQYSEPLHSNQSDLTTNDNANDIEHSSTFIKKKKIDRWKVSCKQENMSNQKRSE